MLPGEKPPVIPGVKPYTSPERKHSTKRGRSTHRKPPEVRSHPRQRKRSRSNSPDTDFAKRGKKLSREIRNETAGRPKFIDFTSEAYLQCAKLFVDSGYTAVDSIRQMQETARQYFLTDLRKGDKTRKPLRELRLVIDIFGLFVIQKDEEKPKYEEITIPEKLKLWSPSITNLLGLLLPDQDACNYFSFELAKGRCETHPIAPFATAEFHKKPWLPTESSHSRAQDVWKTMNKSHKRPSKLELGFQSWVTYNLRFILAGDLASAWKTFGGIAMQLTHMGTVLNLAIAENATIAMAYDAKVRTYANELSEFRSREKRLSTYSRRRANGPNGMSYANAAPPRPSFPRRTGTFGTRTNGKTRTEKERATKEKEKASAAKVGNPTPTGFKATIGSVVPRTTETLDLRTTRLTAHSRPQPGSLRTHLRTRNLRRRNRRNSDAGRNTRNYACQYIKILGAFAHPLILYVSTGNIPLHILPR